MPNPLVLVPTLLGIQFAIFGWRIAREIAVEDQGRRTWLLLSDFLNFASMLAVVSFCIVVPLRVGAFPKLSATVLSAGYVLVAFMPLMIAGHYRLFSRHGRAIYPVQGRPAPRITGQEALFAAIGVLSAAAAAIAVSTK
jgi:hypothetical protein